MSKPDTSAGTNGQDEDLDLNSPQPFAPDTVYHADCVSLLSQWEPGWADLAFADPPFNIGFTYDVYKDKKPHEQYVEWTEHWMAACVRALRPTGSFYIAIGDEYAAEVKIIGEKLGLTLRNWIIWRYTFGQNTKAKFCRSHAQIFYFVRDEKDFTYNDRQLRYPSARHTVYKDKRGHPLGRLPDDTWDEFPRVCGTFKEREGWHGCQMPEGLLARIIRASSNPGDTVLDSFAGSGTTLATAAKLGRRFVGTDISDQYVEHCRSRTEKAKEMHRQWLDHVPADHLDWHPLDEQALIDLYRETKVPIDTLETIEPARDCFVRCLNERTARPGKDGDRFEADTILAKLHDLAIRTELPPIPVMLSGAASHATAAGRSSSRPS